MRPNSRSLWPRSDESLIRQLFHIRRTCIATEYVVQFSILVYHLSYEANIGPLYYTMRFICGLRDDVKVVIMVQRPSTLDSVCALALVHEEVLASGRWRRGNAPNSHSVHRA